MQPEFPVEWHRAVRLTGRRDRDRLSLLVIGFIGVWDDDAEPVDRTAQQHDDEAPAPLSGGRRPSLRSEAERGDCRPLYELTAVHWVRLSAHKIRAPEDQCGAQFLSRIFDGRPGVIAQGRAKN